MGFVGRDQRGIKGKEDVSGGQAIQTRTYTIPHVVLLAGEGLASMASYLTRTSCHKGQCGELAANLRAGCWTPGMVRVPVVSTEADSAGDSPAPHTP